MQLINNKYSLKEQIGTGSFGVIFKGENTRTKELVAIKIESINLNSKLLKNESIIYQYLSNTLGIPRVKWFGKDNENYYMVINLLGESLQCIKNRQRVFSLTKTLELGIQIINLIKSIHEKGLIHRDIKPDNFLLGIDSNNEQIYLIDFGFCKSFINYDKHIEFKKTKNLIGSLTYASINAHCFNELSRRDDLESLGYLLLYFCIGKLNWQDIDGKLSFNEKNELIKKCKLQLFGTVNTQTATIPKVLLNYFKYIRQLKFDEKPNYSILIDLFSSEIKK
jgi:serine/threonine protein kinase